MRNLNKNNFVWFDSYKCCRNEGTLPTLKSMVLGHPVVAEVLLERIPLEDIPEDSEQATTWLHETYFHKANNINYGWRLYKFIKGI